MRVDVSFTPPDRTPEGRTCLVVDVLRATSSMVVLLERGIEGIYPAASIAEGRSRRDRLQLELGREVVLCGEEHALPPEGYDFGNSPSELIDVPMPWREAVVATSNGTPALLACVGAPLVLAAAPLNAGAAARAAVAAGHDVLVVCSGAAGREADDDTLAAGLLVQQLVEAGVRPETGAQRALATLDGVAADFAAALRTTAHGRLLAEIGFAHDIDFCGTVNRFTAVGALRQEGAGPVLRPLSAGDEATGGAG